MFLHLSVILLRGDGFPACITGFMMGGLHPSGISLTLVYSSTNMSKSVWTSGFWKPLIHKNMSNFWNNIFHKFSMPKSNLMKKVPMAEKVLTLLTGLYYMYRNSPLNRTNLKNAFRCLSINIKLPTRAGGTR